MDQKSAEHEAADPRRGLREKAASTARLAELEPEYLETLEQVQKFRRALGNGEFDWRFWPGGCG